MQLDILNKKHENLIKEVLNLSLDDFKKLTYDELDKIVDDTILWIECDENSPHRVTASEIINSIYGPYNPVVVNSGFTSR